MTTLRADASGLMQSLRVRRPLLYALALALSIGALTHSAPSLDLSLELLTE